MGEANVVHQLIQLIYCGIIHDVLLNYFWTLNNGSTCSFYAHHLHGALVRDHSKGFGLLYLLFKNEEIVIFDIFDDVDFV